jgi:GntR family transcriptional regulator/MocR family aminotransferase
MSWRRQPIAELASLVLDRGLAVPCSRQLHAQLRERILRGELAAGICLPSSRALAAQLECSRMTVVAGYGLLEAEGLLIARRGSGFVVGGPGMALRERTWPSASPLPIPEPPRLSQRGSIVNTQRVAELYFGGLLSPTRPDHRLFPFETWARSLREAWADPSDELVNAPPAGYRPLRSAIAGYLREVRGMAVTAEQVLITSGTTNGLALIAQLLLDSGDTVCLEDPGQPDLPAMFETQGLRVVHVPVDKQGIDVDRLRALDPVPRMVLITAAHQYPTGAVLSADRRAALLEWASRTGCIVVEDDYDSELRVRGAPLTGMRTLAGNRSVIYLGTFSKTCFRSIRLGYLVADPQLIEDLALARTAQDYSVGAVTQAAMAKFMASGEYRAHLTRVRRIYARCQAAMAEEITAQLPGLLEPLPSQCGLVLHTLIADALAMRVSDAAIAAEGQRAGLCLVPLSWMTKSAEPRRMLLLGSAGVPERTAGQVVRQLRTVFETLLGQSTPLPTGTTQQSGLV